MQESPGRNDRETGADPLLVFGLGNPGREYEETRHNVGFRLADDLCSFCRIPLHGTSRHAVFGQGRWKNKPVVIVKPLTYMNRSGAAVKELMDRFSCARDSILAVCDDASLPLGQLRFRPGGSSGGQKGLQSIIEQLGSDDFPRLRLGIGGAPKAMPLEDYVLDRFLPEEEQSLEDMIWKARDGVLCLLESGVLEAMNRFNQRIALKLEQEDRDGKAEETGKGGTGA